MFPLCMYSMFSLGTPLSSCSPKACMSEPIGEHHPQSGRDDGWIHLTASLSPQASMTWVQPPRQNQLLSL